MSSQQPAQAEVLILTRMNRANSRSRLGRKREAIADYEQVIRELDAYPTVARFAALAAQNRIILAEEYALLGETQRAVMHLEAGTGYFEGLYTHKSDVARNRTQLLHYHGKAAKVLQVVGRTEEALSHLGRAMGLLYAEVTHGSRPSVWESMLGEWSRLSAQAVEYRLALGRHEDLRAAFIEAESTKGRLLNWIRWAHRRHGDERALDKQRHEQAVDRSLAWCQQSHARYVVSFFGTDNGLALFLLSGNAGLRGAWIADAPYQEFLVDSFRPWEDLFEAAETSPRFLPWVGGMTEFLLDRVGEWIARLAPELSQGGYELVLVPHRLFRSLPLSHCRLPGGRRLSALFDRVLTVPSLFDFAQALEAVHQPPPASEALQGFVDPDGSLAFARLEGHLIVGSEQLHAGQQVTIATVRAALRSAHTLLLSCHGSFDATNPWASRLHLSDGVLELGSVLRRGQPSHRVDLLVLGACEAGKHRHSMSDEPVGFPGTLVVMGIASAVLAPMWKVDDFAAALFLTDFFGHLQQEEHPATAAQKAADHLRGLTAKATLTILEAWSDCLSKVPGISAEAFRELELMRSWLSQLPWDTRPFRSPRDWAAFQLLGVPIARKRGPEATARPTTTS